MSKKLILLAAVSLLTAMPVAYGEDPYALGVNGTSLTIDDDENVLRLSSYTYEFWMKDLEGPTGSWRNIFCKGPGDTAAGRGPLLALRPDDPGLHFSHSTGTAQETANITEGITVNVWTHVALVLTALDGDQIIYLDGVEAVTESVSALTDTTQTAVLRVGLGANVVLDDFRVWNYARTQEEIQADMNREVTGVEEGLVGYWRFNEGEGTIAYDMSPYENHGNITAPVWTADAAPIAPGKPPVVASRPDPANGELYPDTWITLSWRPGDFAVSHDVYMGDNFDDVNSGAAHTFVGNVASPMQIVGFAGFPFPDGLVPGTTYYWRVDEINDGEPNSPWKGDIWSFWIPSASAYDPSPADGAQYVGTDLTLTWQPGHDAKLHNIVFGDSFDDVNSAPAGSPVTTTSFSPEALEKGKTYYWRVDEFNPPFTIRGDVWSFTTLANIPITDPNLVGWWKLDDDADTVAVDSSGYDNYGTLQSDPQWTIGYDGGALSFDGVDDFVQIPHDETLTVDNEVTVMAWIHTSRHGGPGTQGYQGIISKGNPPRSYSLYTQEAGTLHFSTTSAGTYVGSSSDTQVPLNEWVHVAAMVADGQHLYYINGEPAGTGGGGIELPGMTDTSTVVIGRTNEGATRSFLGMIDDVRIYNRALTQDEVNEIMRGDTTLAWGPAPAHGSTPDINAAMPLAWSAGDKAAEHDVYFGTDKEAVKAADASDASGVYRGRQSAATYNPPEGVEWGGGPYYWRVDESNTDGTISTGRIWSFAVADFLLVDDFESYNDIDPPDANSYRIFDVWIDGFGVATNGSLVGNDMPPYAERGVVHTGSQSMIYRYDNNLVTSEATLTLTDRKNWTEQGVAKLSLWLIGDPANVAERLFVALNGTAVVYHNDLNVALTDTWTEWVIDLSSFADQGVNLANVNSITIGFGTKNSPASGGAGTMYFDDIRLYR
ncbi:MAG: LamG domain-containing protein [Planctomycetota bacterium]|jgi:hypothetical protein